MAEKITKPPFSSILNPFVDAILHEQDHNAQIGSALCLAAAIEAARVVDKAQLQKLVPRFLKLVRSEGYKAKAALLGVIGSVVSVGGATSRNVVSALVGGLGEVLGSDDWAARKAAAEVLGRLAVAERDLVVEFRSACLVVLESRRFDKVKVVRDTMNRTMELWRKVPGDPERVLSRSQSKSFSKDDVGARCSPTLSRSSSDDTFETPKLKKTPPTSRPPSSDNSTATIGLKRSPSKSVDKKPSITMMGKLDVQKKSDWSIEIAVLQPSSLQVASNVDSKDGNIEVVDSITNESSRSVKSETKRVLFSETYHEKLHKFGGLRSGSRVVPYSEIDDCESDVVESNAIEDVDGNQKDVEGLNMIRKQLVQIENQQSNLFDLLQRLIGSSQSGMNFLETRVNGLEKALDEISYDLGLSTGKISNTDSGGNACCMLPAADFVSPKFWKRTEGHYSSRFSLPGRNRSLTAMHSMPNKDANVEISNLGNPIDQCQSWDRFVASPVADTHRNLRGGMQSCSSKNLKKISQDADKLLVCGGGGVEGTFTPSCIAAANMCRRSCA